MFDTVFANMTFLPGNQYFNLIPASTAERTMQTVFCHIGSLELGANLFNFIGYTDKKPQNFPLQTLQEWVLRSQGLSI
jgi:hypothetical protein